jgi:type II secretory pathway component PulC
MSTLLLSLARENPWPGLALASLNLVVALSLVGVSLLLGVIISLLAWLHALVDQEAVPIKRRAERRKRFQRGSRAL